MGDAVRLSWWSLLAFWALAIIPVLWLRRRADAQAWVTWSEALQDDAARHYAYIQDLLLGNADLVSAALDLAQEHWRRGGVQEAAERLVLALDTLGRFAVHVRRRLQRWRLAAAASSTIETPAALHVRSFETKSLIVLAAAEPVLQALVVTASERFCLRLSALDWAFLLVASRSTRARRRMISSHADESHGLAATMSTARGVVGDFGVLSSATVACGLLLLRSRQRCPPGTAPGRR